MYFQDRSDAGRWLAGELTSYATCSDLLVLGILRGGVPVAFEVARILHAPLDVLPVRSLRIPGDQELSLGAIASNGMFYLNREMAEALNLAEPIIRRFIAKEQRELARCEQRYHNHRPAHYARGRTVILVDDGMATGATMQVALARLRQEHPARIIVAVPVAAVSACKQLATQVDALVCLFIPERFFGIGCWYGSFPTVTDDEICTLLQQTEPAAILG